MRGFVKQVVAFLVKALGNELRAYQPHPAAEEPVQGASHPGAEKRQRHPEELQGVVGQVVHGRPPECDLVALAVGLALAPQDFDLNAFVQILLFQIHEMAARHCGFDAGVAAETAAHMRPFARFAKPCLLLHLLDRRVAACDKDDIADLEIVRGHHHTLS